MLSLYEITQTFQNLHFLLAEELATEDELRASMEQIDAELEDKADAYASFITSLKGEEDMIDAEIKRLQGMKQSRANKREMLKRNLENSMILTGKVKFKTPLHSYWIQKNPGRLKVDIDYDKLPTEFQITTITPDNDKIKAAIKEGQTVEGCEIIPTESIRIR